jgi:TonB family protein
MRARNGSADHRSKYPPIRGEHSLTGKLVLSVVILLVGTRLSSQNDTRVSHPGAIVAPHEIDTPEPEYSEEARKAKRQGTVVLSLTVDSDGSTRNIKVLVPLGFGLDEKAVEAVKHWKFAPAMKDAKSVAAEIHVAVRFTLYKANIGQVELASSTEGVDFTTYLVSVVEKVNNKWAEQAISTGKPEVTLQFAIQKQGRVIHVKTISPSGDSSLDRAARYCLSASSPFQPLPVQFKGKEAVLRMQFLSNSAGLTISPDFVTVASGTSKQFSIKLETKQDPPVNWSLSGEGCTGSTCGTISADGLYRAPERSTGPVYVMVKAALKGNPGMNATAVVMVSGR